MNPGRPIEQIETELKRQLDTRRDFIAPAGRLRVMPNPLSERHEPIMTLDGTEDDPDSGERDYIGAFGINEHAHGQIAEWTKIPKAYYDRMRAEDTPLLAHNVNTWLQRDGGSKRMVRTLDGNVRAFLSDSYRILDNWDLAQASLPVLRNLGATIVSAEITDSRFFIKARAPHIREELTNVRERGDIVEAAVVISNSEIGNGALRVEPMIFRLVCLNGMISGISLRKIHLGRYELGDSDDVTELLSESTKRVSDVAFWMSVRDVIGRAFDEEVFRGLVKRIDAVSNDQVISNDLQKVVEVVSKRFNFSDTIQHQVFRSFVEDGDMSRWGLANAVTRVGGEIPDYNKGYELQKAGGAIIELQPRDWKTIAEAA